MSAPNTDNPLLGEEHIRVKVNTILERMIAKDEENSLAWVEMLDDMEALILKERKEMADYVAKLIDTGYRTDTALGSNNFKQVVKEHAELSRQIASITNKEEV